MGAIAEQGLGQGSWQAAQAQREQGPDYLTTKERMFIEELQLPPP